MILRKPYAFLIKYFKLIHFILFLLLVFICFKTNDIYTYFKSCVSNKSLVGSVTEINPLIFFLILIAIFIFTVIFILLNKKKKPKKLYAFSIIFYTFFIVSLLVVNSQLYSLLIKNFDIRVLNTSKGLITISYYGQFIFIVYCLIRATGFNIKKFNFEKDLNELSISSDDKDEFELDVRFDFNDVKTSLKRLIRMFKYIIKENPFLFISFPIFLVIIGIVISYENFFVYNKEYKEKAIFNVNDFTVKVLNSYETSYDYLGNKIVDNNIFNIVEVELTNNSDEDKILNTDYIKIVKGENVSYNIVVKYNSKFLDIGQGYKKQKIKSKDTVKYLFIYLVPNDNQKTIFKMLINTTRKDGKTIYNYANVKLDLKKDKEKVNNTYSIGNKINLNNSVLKNSSVILSEYLFTNKDIYQYEKEINNKKYTFSKIEIPNVNDYYDKTLLKVKMNIEYDKSLNEDIKNNFFEKYASIRCVDNDILYEYSDIIQNDSLLNDNYTYLSVPKVCESTKHIYLDFVIRNVVYTYELR